ncbi:hypothetical protein SNOG_13121 [Parastagonospora nodorum SN15]|uniref:Uncharacterized protein n=1 Tax=Phaeosphaeria nodorum (strain SN15 / ATCC MYA-4574 / FGSC 10173) TaxID=321614 RepID=Q0U543_PHANO|nr:hypothetical protein SNOG_13121 [Parastagonospora nodorum SN15]EAT79448.1 hypothetical protein SNOG_13121 [Parastagonospora nodorum SN15]
MQRRNTFFCRFQEFISKAKTTSQANNTKGSAMHLLATSSAVLMISSIYSAIRRWYAKPMECYKRGEFEVQLQIDGIGGIKELALAAAITDSKDASQYVVFFTTDDCNPDSVIDNAWLDKGCSSKLPNAPTEYKSCCQDGSLSSIEAQELNNIVSIL